MADVKKCDRCGKFYAVEDKSFKVNGKVVGYINLCTPNDDYVTKQRDYDLCDDCARDLWHWLCDDIEVEEAPMVDHEELVDYIAANSTLSKTAIRDILDLEMQYLENNGIAQPEVGYGRDQN